MFFPDGLCFLLVKSLASILQSQANPANATKIFCRHLGSLSQTPKSIITLSQKKQKVKDVLIFCISAHVKAPVCEGALALLQDVAPLETTFF